MDGDKDLERIENELNDPFSPLLLARADWCEEHGQLEMARAYRRIVQEGKVPDTYPEGWCWKLDQPWHTGSSTRFCVAERVYEIINQYYRDLGVSPYTASLSFAYHALALAYVEQEKVEKRKVAKGAQGG